MINRGDKRSVSIFLIINLVISIISISFILSGQIVYAQEGNVNILLNGNPTAVSTNGLTGEPLKKYLTNTYGDEFGGIVQGGGVTPPPVTNTAGAVETFTLAKNSIIAENTVNMLGAGAKVTPTVGEFAGKSVVLGEKLAAGGYNVVSVGGKEVIGQISNADLIGGKVGQLPTSVGTGAKQGFLSKMFSPTGGAMGLLKAAGWAATTYMVVGLVAGWLGASDELSKALIMGGGNK